MVSFVHLPLINPLMQHYCKLKLLPQSSGRGMGDWTWKYDGDVHLGKVHGGEYTICSKDSRYIGDKSCQESQMLRKCVRQYGYVCLWQ